MMNSRVLKPTVGPKSAFGARAVPKVPTFAGLVGGVSAIVAVAPAFAEEVAAPVAAPVDGAVDTLVSVIQSAGDLVKAGVAAVSSGIEIAKQGYEVAAPVIQQGVDIISPYASKAKDAAISAYTAAAPVVTSAISNTGADAAVSPYISTVTTTAKAAATTASPYISKATEFVTTTDPVLLAEYGLGFAAFLVLAPGILDSLKGYAGTLTAAAVQDKIVNNGAFLVDIRTTSQKESGLPDLPSSASKRYLEVEFASTADRKLRGSLNNVNDLEVQVTALQIAALKRIGKGSTIVLMDTNGSQAPTVAKALASKGFGMVYTISGGFNGGWVPSKLQIKPSASFSGGSSGTFFTSKKALPAPK